MEWITNFYPTLKAAASSANATWYHKETSETIVKKHLLSKANHLHQPKSGIQMKRIMDIFLSFTNKNYSTTFKLLSLIPGTIVFLIISPLFLFYISRYISQFTPFFLPRSFETFIAFSALLVALTLMTWGMLSLWIDGKGTPAPIAPTHNLVTAGPYKLCRNPIELGTDLYFLGIGTLLDTLTTGIFCMFLGMLLGYCYIKIIEERELKLRFGKRYEAYRDSTPLFIIQLFPKKNQDS